MNIKFLTTASNPKHPGWEQLERSLIHFGWDYKLIVHEWHGFGSKMLALYDHLIGHPETDFFVYSDSYDSFVLDTPNAAHKALNPFLSQGRNQIMFGTEKACYPIGEYRERYPELFTNAHQWKYLNGGCFAGWSKAYIAMVENHKEQLYDHDINDQLWSTEAYLLRNSNLRICLETLPRLYQTIGFEHNDDFAYRQGRLINLETLTMPIIIHGNGKVDMSHIYRLLP